MSNLSKINTFTGFYDNKGVALFLNDSIYDSHHICHGVIDRYKDSYAYIVTDQISNLCGSIYPLHENPGLLKDLTKIV